MSEIREHRLKIRPEFYKKVLCGSKKAELRKNDRGFQVHDTLRLEEWDVLYTGNTLLAQITDVTDVSEWLDGYVLLSLDVRQEFRRGE